MSTPPPIPAPESVLRHNRGRDPRRLALKLEKMAASPFAFFRGACHRFYEVLPDEGLTRDAPAVWIAGDLHLENFGSYKGDNRLVYFDLNDFDEACLAPLTWDVVRFQASVFLGASLLGVGAGPAEELARLFGSTYAEVLREGHARWIERRTARGVVRDLLRDLRERDQGDLLDARAPVRRGKRAIRVGGAPEDVKALEADPTRRREVQAALAALGKAAAAGKAQELEVLDVQDRVAGTGSLGLPRYVILTRGDGGRDGAWLLDAKAVPPSAPARTSPCTQPGWPSESERAATLQRALQAVPPARLATLAIAGAPYLLRELLPSEDRVDLARAAQKRERLRDLIEDMARVVAWAHLRGAGRMGAAGPDALDRLGARSRVAGPAARAGQARGASVPERPRRAGAGAAHPARASGRGAARLSPGGAGDVRRAGAHLCTRTPHAARRSLCAMPPPAPPDVSATGSYRTLALLALAAGLLLGTHDPLVAAPERVVDVSTVEELRRAAAEAKPGTRIRLAPGTYAGGIHLTGLSGAPGRPIVIASRDPAAPAVIEGGGSGLQLTDAVHVELVGLSVRGQRGNGVNLDDGGTPETPSHHVTLRGLTVRDVGPNGNCDGIKLSGLEDLRVEGCTVERWGRGGSAVDLVGCRRGTIEGSTFRHGAEASGASGVQMKGASAEIVVRKNRFEHAGGRAVNAGGSTGLEYFRPPLETWKGPKYEATRAHDRGQHLRGQPGAGGLRGRGRRRVPLQHRLPARPLGAAHPAGDARGGLRPLAATSRCART